MKKLLFIYNANAGKGKVKSNLAAILEAFAQKGYLSTACPTLAPGDATNLAQRLGRKFRRVVCCGGDGTLHEVVSGLMQLEERPVLGYIPAGTTNDFSRNLNLPRAMDKAAHLAVSGTLFPCDMGRFNGQPFVYVAAFGAFTEVAYGTPQEFKNIFGHLAYLMEGITRLGAIRSHPLTITHDEGIVTGEFIFGMVSNTVSVGGFQGLPTTGVALDDGLFEVLLVRTPRTPMELQSILTSLMKQNPVEGGSLSVFRTKSITFDSPEALDWTLDGEFGGSATLVSIENCQHAITIARG